MRNPIGWILPALTNVLVALVSTNHGGNSPTRERAIRRDWNTEHAASFDVLWGQIPAIPYLVQSRIPQLPAKNCVVV